MSKKLTKDQKDRYVESPYRCPYCNSSSIEWQDSPNLNDSELDIEVGCNDCHMRWTEIYTISGIEET